MSRSKPERDGQKNTETERHADSRIIYSIMLITGKAEHTVCLPHVELTTYKIIKKLM